MATRRAGRLGDENPATGVTPIREVLLRAAGDPLRTAPARVSAEQLLPALCEHRLESRLLFRVQERPCRTVLGGVVLPVGVVRRARSAVTRRFYARRPPTAVRHDQTTHD